MTSTRPGEDVISSAESRRSSRHTGGGLPLVLLGRMANYKSAPTVIHSEQISLVRGSP